MITIKKYNWMHTYMSYNTYMQGQIALHLFVTSNSCKTALFTTLLGIDTSSRSTHRMKVCNEH